MAKRRRQDDDPEPRTNRPRKRVCPEKTYDILTLSDELIIKILSFLSVPELSVVERTSRRFRQLATDSSIWRSKYYDKWVKPRAMRLPGAFKNSRSTTFSLKFAKWLEHSHLLRTESETDFKTEYKIRTNWARGSCRVKEVEIATPRSPPVLVKINQGLVFTADNLEGLRAWSNTKRPRLLWSHSLVEHSSPPTSLAVDARGDRTFIALGFGTGTVDVLTFDKATGFGHVRSIPGKTLINALAVTMPFILTLSNDKLLRLLQLPWPASAPPSNEVEVLATLRSDVSYSPMSLALRRTGSSITACVAYPFSRLNAGWCIGLQEIKLSLDGQVLNSRLVSTVDTPIDNKPHRAQRVEITSRSASSQPLPQHPQLRCPPSSISYSHPYLLASLGGDNTLMVYLVKSDGDGLEVSSGRRLWGHTSAIAAAEVSERGKAVSISARGNEMRVWDLEEALTLLTYNRTSTQVTPTKQLDVLSSALRQRGDGLGLALKEMKEELSLVTRWVGFDDRQVVVLGERDNTQVLSCYDFT